MNRNGFTLIELLAVILILGIIALIAIPSASKVIDQSKKGSFELTTNNLVNGVKTICTSEQIRGKFLTGTYSIIDGKVIGLDVNMSGQLPENGTINVDNNCRVSIYAVDKSDRWYAVKTFKAERVTVYEKGQSSPELDDYEDEPTNEVSTNTCFTYEKNSTGVTITGYKFDDPKCSKNIVIPTSIENRPVTRLSDFAFMDKSRTLVEIIVYEYEHNFLIADSHVYGHSTGVDYVNPIYLYSTLRPDEIITQIVCTPDGNESVYLPKDYKHVAGDGYIACQTVVDIDEDCNCGNVAPLVDSIDFSKASHLTEIPRGLAIGTGLSSVNLGSKITKIGTSAFGKNNIRNVVFPDSLQEIGVAAFRSNHLTQVNLNKVSKLGNYSFQENQIDGIDYGSNLSVISTFAFANNINTYITFPPTIIEIGEGAFSNSSTISVSIPGTVKTVGIGAFASDGNEGTITNVSIAEGVTTIKMAAFLGTQIESLVIPKSVTSSDVAFYGMSRLKSVTLTDGITSLGEEMFGSTGLTSLVIPDSVTSIGPYLCYDCTKLKNLTLSTKLTTIPTGAFSNTIIENLTIPNSVTSIGDQAFDGVKTLKTVSLGSNLKTIGAYAFSGNALTQITVPSKVTKIDKYAFANDSSNRISNVTIDIGSSISTIGSNAFQYMNTPTININRAANKVSGSPWGSSSPTVNWTGTK